MAEKLEFKTESGISLEQRRESFFKNIKNKLMSLALAGFITFGPGTLKDSYAEQLRMAKKDKAVPEFVFESGITEEKLALFRKTLEENEPEFIEWINLYKQKIISETDEMLKVVLKVNPDKDREEEKLLANHIARLNSDLPGEGGWSTDYISQADHKILGLMAKRPGLIKEYTDFLKDNIDKVILSFALLSDSPEIRKSLIANGKPPEIDFHYHNFFYYADNNPNPTGITAYEFVTDGNSGTDKTTTIQPNIKLTPRAFAKPDSGLNLNGYTDVFVHELIHSLTLGSFNSQVLSKNSVEAFPSMRTVLSEGRAQNITNATMQYFGQKKKGLSPEVGASEYDQRVIIASIIEAILKAGNHDDTLAKWDSLMISSEDFIKELDSALEKLGLDTGIAEDVRLERSYQTATPALDLLVKILARLKITGVKVSPELIRDVLIKGRDLSDWQISGAEHIIRMKELPTEIADQEEKIKKKK